MTEQEIKEIYSHLLGLTKVRAIQWKKTGNSEYAISFSRSTVVVERDWNFDEPVIAMNIFNEDGLLIAYACETDLARNEAIIWVDFDPAELFNLIEGQVYKYSETSKNILDELKALEHKRKSQGPELSEREEWRLSDIIEQIDSKLSETFNVEPKPVAASFPIKCPKGELTPAMFANLEVHYKARGWRSVLLHEHPTNPPDQYYGIQINV
ncbi:MAG: hypothetical protein QOH63_3207 [Acidobacteriota bacterium]|jgi:hypothetical protein|nr:hypothetical protein [Acidobacteriota bacterium]